MHTSCYTLPKAEDVKDTRRCLDEYYAISPSCKSNSKRNDVFLFERTEAWPQTSPGATDWDLLCGGCITHHKKCNERSANPRSYNNLSFLWYFCPWIQKLEGTGPECTGEENWNGQSVSTKNSYISEFSTLQRQWVMLSDVKEISAASLVAPSRASW